MFIEASLDGFSQSQHLSFEGRILLPGIERIPSTVAGRGWRGVTSTFRKKRWQCFHCSACLFRCLELKNNPYATVIYFRAAYSSTFLHNTLKVTFKVQELKIETRVRFNPNIK